MSDQPVTAEDFKRMFDDALKSQAQEPQRQARAEFIAQQQARAFDGLDAVPAEYHKMIGDDPARWGHEVRHARLQWLFDTGKASATQKMELGMLLSKPARETQTSSLTLKDHIGGGGPNRAA
jgi:hypothetical protein